MSTPSIIQMDAQLASVVDSLAFTDDVSDGGFLFCVAIGDSTVSVSDNINGAWTVLAAGAAQGALPYTIAYFPASAAGAVTVSFTDSGSPFAVLPFIVEITPATLATASAVASGTISGSSAVEFTSAQIAALAGELLLGYGFTQGNGVQSVGGSYNAQVIGTPPVRTMLETQTATTGDFNSDFFSRSNINGVVWATGIISLATATYSIGGNAGVAGATVSYSGAASGSVTADGSGNYTIPALANGTYTITPSKATYTFSPTSRNEVVSGSNITGANFTATQSTYSISGIAGAAYAVVSYSGTSSGQVVADADGNYSIPNLVDGSYTLAPSLSGYVFSPTSQSKTISGANIPNVNFTAAQPNAPTRNTVTQGNFRGASFAAAFPQNSVRKFNVLQIRNSSGAVVWLLDGGGNVVTNPPKSLWTAGTILDEYSGDSFAAAFIQNNANRGKLDILQISTEGGSVIWWMDWQGTVHQA